MSWPVSVSIAVFGMGKMKPNVRDVERCYVRFRNCRNIESCCGYGGCSRSCDCGVGRMRNDDTELLYWFTLFVMVLLMLLHLI